MDNKLRSVVIGHADERVTDEIYTTVDEETLQAIASKIDPLAAALGSATLHRRERAGGSLPWGMG